LRYASAKNEIQKEDQVPLFSFVFFALVERKKDKHMIEEYHAAAGKNASL